SCSHTVRAVPYSGAGGDGASGPPIEISFKVVTSSTKAPTPPPASSPADKLKVTKLVLVDAAKQKDVKTLAKGTTVDLSDNGRALDRKSVVKGEGGGVVVDLTGRVLRA